MTLSDHRVSFRQNITEGQEEKAKEIAVSLKEQGVAIDIIVKATGLSKTEINKL